MTFHPTHLTIIFTWHDDPGHSWLEVRQCHLDALGLTRWISHYSYRVGDNVYLEEDCDAGLFLRAAERASWDIDFTLADHPDFCFIRDLPRYRAKPETVA